MASAIDHPGFLEAELAPAPMEARITEPKDSPIGTDLPVPSIVGRRGHSGHWSIEGLSAH